MPASEQVAFLRSLPSIRTRCEKVYDLAAHSKTDYWTLDPARLSDVVAYTARILTRDFGHDFSSIPPHGRWQHFDAGNQPRVQELLSTWTAAGVPQREQARKLVDLFLVSVLLDAGAGPTWQYTEPGTSTRIGRSEGLAVASLHMFLEGLFASSSAQRGPARQPPSQQADAQGLAQLTPGKLAHAMQVSPTNPMDGLAGRAALLARLGQVLEQDQAGFFAGVETKETPAASQRPRRPGNLVDYLASHPSTRTETRTNPATGNEEKVTVVQVPVLWDALVLGLNPIWPAEDRILYNGERMGDVWVCESLRRVLRQEHPDWTEEQVGYESLVPFHKLTQWLCYSLLSPLTRILNWRFEGGQNQTGLPEYRNGGLFMDYGVLVPTDKLYRAGGVEPPAPSESNTKGQDHDAPSPPIPRLTPFHPAVVEWRALTVCLLDRTAQGLREHFSLTPAELSLPQVLEAATWKGGREIAAKKRAGGVPPISIVSDGTVF